MVGKGQTIAIPKPSGRSAWISGGVKHLPNWAPRHLAAFTFISTLRRTVDLTGSHHPPISGLLLAYERRRSFLTTVSLFIPPLCQKESSSKAGSSTDDVMPRKPRGMDHRCITTETFSSKVRLKRTSVSSWLDDIGIFSTPCKAMSRLWAMFH